MFQTSGASCDFIFAKTGSYCKLLVKTIIVCISRLNCLKPFNFVIFRLFCNLQQSNLISRLSCNIAMNSQHIPYKMDQFDLSRHLVLRCSNMTVSGGLDEDRGIPTSYQWYYQPGLPWPLGPQLSQYQDNQFHFQTKKI